MKTNLRPYLLLFLLSSAILFLVGFRYGRIVEKLDKNYVSPFPTAVPTRQIVLPTDAPVKYRIYNSLLCQVSFIIPDILKIQSKNDVEILSDNNNKITVNCNEKSVRKTMIDYEEATPSAIYKSAGQNIYTFVSQKNYSLWTIKNPKNQQLILFEVNDNLVPMVIKTLEFANLPQPTL